MSPALQTHQICTKCGEEKPRKGFTPCRNRGPDTLQSWCKTCCNLAAHRYREKNRTEISARRRRWYKNDPTKQRANNFYHSYRISLSDHEAMRTAQSYCCAICGVHESMLSRKLVVDHNHVTGRVRALLCHNCNVAEGNIKTAERAEALVAYMEYHAVLDEAVLFDKLASIV